MGKLVSGEVKRFNSPASLAFNASMTSGSVTLSIQIEDETATDVTDGAFTEATTGVIHIPACNLTATITVDAELADNNTRY
ncbi:MAG: hypothetical protein GY799_14305 [Desulfobulbaceae bacterium]|nr:hypothetical protein [Desulfobulbaceae bacterium]